MRTEFDWIAPDWVECLQFC